MKDWILETLITIYKKYGNLFQGKIFYAIILVYKLSRTTGYKTAIKRIIKYFPEIKVYKSKKPEEKFKKLLENVKLENNCTGGFYYNIDIFKTCGIGGKILGNCSIDYRKFIECGYHSFMISKSEVSRFAYMENETIKILDLYIERICKLIDAKDDNKFIRWLERFPTTKAENIEDALQRILIINSLLWQNGHILVGLGRLDKALEQYCDDKRTDEELVSILCDFMSCIHGYYEFKSNALVGDTGQIIILGGNDEAGGYTCNRFTILFIDALIKLQLPDPKILIRISKRTPDNMWQKIFEYIASKNGSPLLSNDDLVIPKLIDFGYKASTAYDYTTSSCWEPVPGGSYEQNNIVSLNMLKPIEYLSRKRRNINSFEDVKSLYFEGIRMEINKILSYLDTIVWETDLLQSLVNDGCRDREMDAAEGGCDSNNYGILTVGMANAVNSLLNIEKVVFCDHMYSFNELDDIRKKNFRNHEYERQILLNSELRFGIDDYKVINLTNEIMMHVTDCCRDYRNKFGGRLKVGYSSPHYIMNCSRTKASFDGRKKNSPFSVHISNDRNNDLLSLFNFASKLNYSDNRFNGNVVDFIVPYDLITRSKEKFEHAVRKGFDSGIYQMQMNVVSSKVLMKAKECPSDFPNLIVRVWGFNSFFVDLPEVYQDYLIERVINYENSC